MLYDFQQTSGTNRGARDASFPLRDVEDRRVGLQIYPRLRTSGTDADRNDHAIHAIFNLRWLAGTTKIVFGDEADLEPAAVNAVASNVAGRPRMPPPIVNLSIVAADVHAHKVEVVQTQVSSCASSREEDCRTESKITRIVDGKAFTGQQQNAAARQLSAYETVLY
jgi:hypothetical protein